MSADPSRPDPALALFHPIVRRWFAERVGTPTDVQRRAWPEIASGRHVLVTAPTGTGKTLTAFLWALDRLLTGATPGGTVRVLYVSPLKALNADVHRNLEVPLAELSERFTAAGAEAPSTFQPVRAQVRSGDTPQSERQKMIRRPPEILITTPESLNLLLTSAGGRSILDGLETVILDEIHAVAGTKRGTHLATAVERLTLLSGEFQRVALSATVRPLRTVADFVGGLALEEAVGGAWSYRKRPVEVVASEAEKEYDLTVRYPGDPALGAADPQAAIDAERRETSVWDLIVPVLKETVRSHRSTLVFANSRRLTEKLTRMVNAGETTDLAYSHHGSLSREVRQVVEERLKRGELPAIVATSSLELGIDIGALDRVVMVESPRSIASAVQRVGRAGHRVGEVSRGTLLPIYGRDFLDAAVVVRAVLDREIEETRPIHAPLDVLAQVILSMTVAETWRIDELYAFVKTAWPYRDLPRRHFDLVLEMLAGRYADSRIRELSPRISLDKVEGTVAARPGAARILYLSGGTIPDRGYYHLRVDRPGGAGAAPSSSRSAAPKIGELDEEFVWERSVGDTFTLGTQIWRIRRITHNDVFVEPASGSAAMAPFWRADERDREFFFSEKVSRFLERVEGRLDLEGGEGIVDELRRQHAMDRGAAAELVRFLRSQKAAMGGKLPHRHRVMVEHIAGDEGGAPSSRGGPEAAGRRRIVLHTFWGGKVNRPLAVALATAWEESYGAPLEILHDDDCLMVTVPEELGAGVGGPDLFALVPPERIEELLRERLERTGFFGALFRQNASRALLLPRAGFRHRTPLWITRQRAKKLLESVRRYGDFPVVLETWRSCLEDELDLETLKRLLDAVRSGEIEVRHVRTDAPSPFAANLVWKQTNTLMYDDDRSDGEGGGGRGAAIHRDLLRELVFSSHLRPRIPASVAEDLRQKVQRLAPGYAPRTGVELLDWIKERGLVPEDEWAELTKAVDRDLAARGEEARAADLMAEIADRAVLWRPPGAVLASAVAVERLPRTARAFGLAADRGLGELALSALAGADEPAPEAAHRNLERMARMARMARMGQIPGPDGESDQAPGVLNEQGEPAEAADLPDLAGLPDLADLVGEWLRFQGPVVRGRLERVFGLGGEALGGVLEALVEEERVVVDELTVGGASPDRTAGQPEVCDTANLETLLRWTRAAARPEFRALPVERLPLFLAAHQGLAPRGRDMEDFQNRLEALLGRSLPAGVWERDVLPARLDPYRKGWLDTLLRESELEWVGTGPGRLTFLFRGEGELLVDEEKPPADRAGETGEADEIDGAEAGGRTLDELFPDRRGRFALEDLAAHSGLPVPEISERLWELAWRGLVTTDELEPVRRGILRKFRPPAAPVRSVTPRPGGPGRLRRSRVDRWRPERTPTGTWRVREVDLVGCASAHQAMARCAEAHPTHTAAGNEGGVDVGRGARPSGYLDPLATEELAKDRARLVLDRYGVVFRELLDREPPPFRWGRLFRALRLMELSGEVLAGQFFAGVPGLQFASPDAFRTLRDGLLPDDAVYWMNARDPASLAGVDLPELKDALGGLLPERREGNTVVFHGDRLVLTARRRGKTLDIQVAPDHPRLDDYLDFLKVLLTRDFAPRKLIEVEEINGEPAPESPYLPVLRRIFSTTVEPRSVKLRRRY